MEGWTAQEVADWLPLLGAACGGYRQVFLHHEVDGLTLCGLSDRDLRDDLGVRELGTRRTILRGIVRSGGRQGGGGSGGYVSPQAPPRHDVEAQPPARSGSARTMSPESKYDCWLMEQQQQQHRGSSPSLPHAEVAAVAPPAPAPAPAQQQQQQAQPLPPLQPLPTPSPERLPAPPQSVQTLASRSGTEAHHYIHQQQQQPQQTQVQHPSPVKHHHHHQHRQQQHHHQHHHYQQVPQQLRHSPPPHPSHPGSFTLSHVPVTSSRALTIQCTCCSRRAKLYPVTTHHHCGTCDGSTEWFFVDA